MERQQTAQLVGGPWDGAVVEIKGFQHEVPAAVGSRFVSHVYAWAEDDEGVIYGKWMEEQNV